MAFSCSGEIYDSHSGDMPRSTNTLLRVCAQKRHWGGLAGAEVAEGGCVVMWRGRCVTSIELCRVPEVREAMTASTGKQSTLRVAVHKGRYIRKTRAASGW